MKTCVAESDIASDTRACASREGDSIVDIAHCTNKQALERLYQLSPLSTLSIDDSYYRLETTDKRDWVFAILTNKQKIRINQPGIEPS